MPLDYPSQEYYPGAKLRLILRFEEYGNDQANVAKVPAKKTWQIAGVKDPRSPLKPQQDTSIPGVTRYVLVENNASDQSPAHNQARSSDKLTFDVTVTPKSADWNQNGIRQADTLHAEFKYIDCPIDPRTVRACAVEYYLGVWTAQQYAKNIREAGSSSGGNPMPFIPDGLSADLQTTGASQARSFLRFRGFVDKWDVEWTESGEPLVRLECRDNTSLLIEQEASMTHSLDPKKPIDEAIALYLSHFPAMLGFSVEYRPNNAPRPVLNKILQNTAMMRPNLGPQPSKGGGGDSRMSVWDYLTDVCGSLGHLIHVDGDSVIIETARTYTTSTVVAREDDPFAGGRRLPTGEVINYRRFLYGRNVKEMKVGRSYAKKAPSGVIVRAYNGAHKQELLERFPVAGQGTADRLVPGNAQPDQKWITVIVRGVEDRKTLRLIAETRYISLGRREVEVNIKTNNLASFGGGNSDPDLLDLKPSDTVEVLVNRSNDESNTLTRIEKILTSQGRSEQFMKNMGFAADFASAYAKAYTDHGFLTHFRVRTVKISWSIDEGVEVDVQAVNYIEVRADKQLPDGEAVKAKPTGAARKPAPVQPSGDTATTDALPVPIGQNADGTYNWSDGTTH